MTRTAMTISQIPQSYSDTTLDISAPYTFDYTNGMTAPATGDIIFRLKNSSAGSVTFTVASAPDASGRSDSFFSAKSLAAGADIILPLFHAQGWEQASDALLHFDASATGVLYQALQLPAGD